MTLWANNLNGIASGTTVTTGNSGGTSGTAFSGVSAPSGGSVSAQSAAAFEGASGLRLVWPATSASGYVNWSVAGSTGTRASSSFWYQFSAAPTAVSPVIRWALAHVELDTAGRLGLWEGNGADVVAQTPPISPGTWVFVQVAFTLGATNGTGRGEFYVYTADGYLIASFDSSAVNLGAITSTAWFFGRPVAVTSSLTAYYDLLAVSDSLASGFPGIQPVPVGGNVKVYTGSAFTVKPAKASTATGWVQKPVKWWNGTTWVRTTY